MSKVYISTTGPDDWKRLLADPAKHWCTGRSAKTLAHCWETAKGLPTEIASMLQPQGDQVELLVAIPEYKVHLPGAARAESQNDIFALARAGDRTFAIMIEGKVSEAFAERLGDWLQNASKGKLKRLASICDVLGLILPLPENTYYQLLHRTASAVIEARRFKTDAAAMIVHSFSQKRVGFKAFEQFASLFDVVAKPDELIPIRSNATPPLYIGWASGDCSFLTK
jgi:hypothetical protein